MTNSWIFMGTKQPRQARTMWDSDREINRKREITGQARRAKAH